MGKCLGDTIIQFEKAENSSLKLVGKAKGYVLVFAFYERLLVNVAFMCNRCNFQISAKLCDSPSLILISISIKWELVVWIKNSTRFSDEHSHPEFFPQKLLNS